ncbi:MAG: YciI family protein [Candidatus Kapaibacterium sp.]
MKFLMISTPAPELAGVPPSMEMMTEMGKLIEEMTNSGVLLATGGLLPVSMGGAHVTSSGGTFAVTDGPFTEAKELVAGFAMVEVGSREEALEVSRRFFAIAGDGQGEIRQIMGPGADFPKP